MAGDCKEWILNVGVDGDGDAKGVFISLTVGSEERESKLLLILSTLLFEM